MSEPLLKKYPAEIFGYPFNDLGQNARKIRSEQYCPFIKSECKKPRKSEPHIKVGLCSVGYKGKHSDKYIPVIICPYRFELEVIREKITELYFPNTSNDSIKWLPEVYLGRTVGYFDYVPTEVESSWQKLLIKDFVCVELQAAGTTGTPWEAFQEHKTHGKFLKNSYNYGINWANEFAKTMMQQAYKKGLIISQWNKKLVFVVQDIGLRYLEENYNTERLHSDVLTSDPIHFCTFEMIWDDTRSVWTQEFKRRVSTDCDGISKMLGGLSETDFPTRENFINRLLDKIRMLKV
jgi:hypothetical protein